MRIGASAGQSMTATLSSVESNAVFIIYLPGQKETLPKAGDGQDAQRWVGKLPKTGKYIISVSGTRGNASYKLNLKIK